MIVLMNEVDVLQSLMKIWCRNWTKIWKKTDTLRFHCYVVSFKCQEVFSMNLQYNVSKDMLTLGTSDVE